MVKYVYNEDGEIVGEYPEQNNSSMFKRIMNGVGSEVGGGIKKFHQSILRRRQQNIEMNNRLKLKRKLKYPDRDYNIVHAHERCKIGW